MKQTEVVTLKVSKVDLIELDNFAESLHMNRSEFIKHCVIEKMKSVKNSASINEKQSDNLKIIQAIVETNSLMEDLNQKMMIVGKGVKQMHQATIKLFPSSADELEKIFNWSK